MGKFTQIDIRDVCQSSEIVYEKENTSSMDAYFIRTIEFIKSKATITKITPSVQKEWKQFKEQYYKYKGYGDISELTQKRLEKEIKELNKIFAPSYLR